VYLIGLTGGIASGKSVVAQRLAEHGAIHIDADQLARDVVAPGMPALTLIKQRFGSGVIAEDGSLNRSALGAVIFSEPEARLALNEITHPAVQDLARQRFAEAPAGSVVVYDVPLLVEASKDRSYHRFDLIVVVTAETEVRIGRMTGLRGLTREEAVHRLNSQATDAERLAIADVVIDSNGTLAETLEQADALWLTVLASAQ
jgi:dephospho-CoA kinase